VASLLLGCVGRHEHIVEGAPEACARITHEKIAAMVGSVREVVQRALKELERAGAIRLERARIHILDLDTLSRWSNSRGESED
jgi:CRP/FNR family transcriptional regulator